MVRSPVILSVNALLIFNLPVLRELELAMLRLLMLVLVFKVTVWPLMMTSSPRPGTTPPAQVDAESQFPLDCEVIVAEKLIVGSHAIMASNEKSLLIVTIISLLKRLVIRNVLSTGGGI